LEIARRSRLHVTREARIDLLFTMSDNTSALRRLSRALGSGFSRTRFFARRRRRNRPAPQVDGRRKSEGAEIGIRIAAGQPSGGARRDRTDDLLLAKQALSQLSYGPDQRTDDRRRRTDWRGCAVLPSVFCRLIMVGLGRFELPTSRLSSARSNQLSYKPRIGRRRTDDRGQNLSICRLSSDVCPLNSSFVKKEK
jgi:hypothetical protein